ncbi:MAG: Gfo/Idh/MocA family oxidoreductase [Deferribacteraceae bacterium]|jgi:predicted dehydrogenase|nr:Gfo/Idh/MocA family oxidoreductase [Deferribacteraceae bacterium]
MIKMGLIGLGKMGQYHLNLYDEINGLALAGICDTEAARAEAIGKKCSTPHFSDYKKLLPLADAVTIAAPTKYHYEIAKTCLNEGKHVLVEKPITTNYEEAEELFETAAKKGLVLNIGHVERFNGAVMELKKIVKNPILFEARRVGPFNPNFRNDSIVLDLMIHDIDIAASIGGKAEAVQAMGSPVNTSLADYASVNIFFGGKLSAHIISGRVNQTKERFLNVTQDDALIVLDYTNQDINITRNWQTAQIFGDKALTYKNEFVQERLFVYKENALKAEIKHFLSCIGGLSEKITSPEHDLASLKLALTIDSLLLKGRYGEVVLN